MNIDCRSCNFRYVNPDINPTNFPDIGEVRGKKVKCPLCNSEMRYEGAPRVNDRGVEYTHMWFCPECPFVGLEFYGDADANRAAKRLKKDLRKLA